MNYCLLNVNDKRGKADVENSIHGKRVRIPHDPPDSN